jgi:hypothetical protein
MPLTTEQELALVVELARIQFAVEALRAQMQRVEQGLQGRDPQLQQRLEALLEGVTAETDEE